jgi:hypothetical protein
MQESTPGHFNDVEIRETRGKVGQIAPKELKVAPFRAVTGYATTAGWACRAAPYGPDSRALRRHATFKALDDRAILPARDHRSLGVHPDCADALRIEAVIE